MSAIKHIAQGDLKGMTPEEREAYYLEVCTSLGLNPSTRPFDFLTLNGKLVLYARKDATDQIRKLHGVSITELTHELVEDVLIVTAAAQDASGRRDISKGAVSLAGLKGEALANAYMKAESKAKRRVTLSLCGLGMLDEGEIETIPGATPLTAEPAPVESPPYFRFLAACAKIKAAIGEHRYYDVLAGFNLSKSSHVDRGNIELMKAVYEALREAEAGSAHEPDEDTQAGPTPAQENELITLFPDAPAQPRYHRERV
jgi:hypothetical protein